MSDIFQEVDDDLRHDRMQALAKRYGGVVVGVALMIVVGTAGYKGWEAWRKSTHQAATVELVNGIESAAKDNAGNVDALLALAKKGAPGDLDTLARLDAAGVLASKGKIDDAVAVYDAVASGEAAPVYREVASLLAVLHQIDKGDPKLLAMRLDPLAADASPWRYTARELSALLAIRSGDAERAKTLFKQLSDDVLAPAGVRARAADLAALYAQS